MISSFAFDWLAGQEEGPGPHRSDRRPQSLRQIFRLTTGPAGDPAGISSYTAELAGTPSLSFEVFDIKSRTYWLMEVLNQQLNFGWHVFNCAL